MFGIQFSRVMLDVLSGNDDREWWSRRAREGMAKMRHAFSWLAGDGTTLWRGTDNRKDEGNVWWTFAGTNTNMAL